MPTLNSQVFQHSLTVVGVTMATKAPTTYTDWSPGEIMEGEGNHDGWIDGVTISYPNLSILLRTLTWAC